MVKESKTGTSTPPVAQQIPKTFTDYGIVRDDPYYWLREKNNPEVISHLKAENKYTDHVMSDTEDLQEQLYLEMRARIKEDDTSAPVKIDNYFYYTRTEKDKEYPIYCRKEGSLDGEEEVLLDQNKLAKKMEHCDLGVFEVSPDHNLLAYSMDTDGSERHTIFVKDLQTGKLFSDRITNTYYALEWKNDSSSFVYTTLNETMRPHRAVLHTLGDEMKKDIELYREEDERFFVTLSKSKSKKFIFLEMESKVTTEVHFLDANSADSNFILVNAREQNHEYFVEHHKDSFYIRSNNEALNFKLMKAPITNPKKETWEEVIETREEVFLAGFEVFEQYLCIYELIDGVTNIRIRDLESGDEHSVAFDEEVYAAGSGGNPNFDSSTLRFVYSSFVTPQSVYDYEMDSREQTLVKQKDVLGGYDASQYVVKREYAEASDGEKIPISIAHKKGVDLNGTAPCWLQGYGSYGTVQSTGFNLNRISILDRGFVFAIAHIRGGGEKGRRWYENGKYLCKKNTFTDFITVAEFLVEKKYTSSSKLTACGRSAGGMLMGAVANEKPDLFKAIVADVPFVDVINTMSDPSIPLTVIEYEEWGNPNDQKYFEYIFSYSPYDNVKAQEYPHILVTAGLNDPRVHYWEPAKWVAKLRTLKTDENMLLLKTEMEQGHSGASGRFKFLREVAFEYAFALKALGIST